MFADQTTIQVLSTVFFQVTRQVNVLCPSDWVEVFLISRQLIGLLEEQLDKNVRENIIEEVRFIVTFE